MELNTVSSIWKSHATTLEAELSPGDLQNHKRSFYAGALSMLALQDTLASSGMSEEAFFGIMSGIQEELVEFATQMESIDSVEVSTEERTPNVGLV